MDNTNDQKVTLLYVEYFEGDSGNIEGHPKSGRIYRSVYDQEWGLYKVAFYDDGDPMARVEGSLGGVFVKELTATPENPIQYKFTVITNENIEQLDIEPEDYRKLEEWKQDPTKGIESITAEGETFINMVITTPDEEDIYEEIDIEEAIADGFEEPVEEDVYDILQGFDKGMADTVNNFIFWLISAFKQKNHQLQNPVLEDSVSHEDNVNIYSALRAIELYRKYNDPLLLCEAIDGLLLELRRKP